MNPCMLIHNILNVLNNRMGRLDGLHLEDIFEGFRVSIFQGAMRRFPGVAPKVNIGDLSNITFRVTHGDLLISYLGEVTLQKVINHVS